MHRILSLILAVAACIGACRPAEPRTEVIEVPAQSARFDNSLLTLLPPGAPAWIYVDLDHIRSDSRLAPLLELNSDDGEFSLSQTVDSAHELLVAWADPLWIQRINIARSEVDREALHGELRTTSNWTGNSFQFTQIGPYKVWYQGQEAWGISAPAENLLITGHNETVRATVELVDALEQGTMADLPNLHAIAAGELVVLPLHRQAIAALIEYDSVRARIAEMEHVRFRALLGLGLDLQVDVTISAGVDPAGLVTMIAALLTEFGRGEGLEAELVQLATARLNVDVLDADEGRHTVRLVWEFTRDDVNELSAMFGGP